MRLPDVRRMLAVVVLLGVAVALTLHAGFDVGAARAMLVRRGPVLLLGLLPFVGICFFEAAGWALALGLPLGLRILLRLAPIRVGLESIALTVPGSALASDGVAPFLVGARTGLGLSRIVAAVALKKWGVVLGHLGLLILAVVVGGGLFARIDAGREPLVSSRSMLALFVLFAGTLAGLFTEALRGRFAERSMGLVARLPGERLRALARRARAAALRVDDDTAAFFASEGSPRLLLLVVSLGTWLAESLEVFVLLALLGSDPAFARVLAMEAIVSVARGVAFFAPGGVGVQEAGYLALVPSVVDAGSDGTASALVVLRRARDLALVALGYAILGGIAAGRRLTREPALEPQG